MNENPVDLAAAALAEMHEEHHREVTSAQLGIERMTRALGRPWLAIAVIAFVVVWISVNLWYGAIAHRAFDRPQFPWLELIVSLASLLMTIIILITQNRQDAIAHRRAEVTFQLAVVTEQKVAKVIDLLEELRRDDPHVPDREDRIANAMSEPTDVLEAASKVDELGRTRS